MRFGLAPAILVAGLSVPVSCPDTPTPPGVSAVEAMEGYHYFQALLSVLEPDPAQGLVGGVTADPCVDRTVDGQVHTYSFDDCSAPHAIRGLTGDVVVTPRGETVTVKASGIALNGYQLSFDVSLPLTGELGGWSVVTPSGDRLVNRLAVGFRGVEPLLTQDGGCLDAGGFLEWRHLRNGEDTLLIATGYKRCGDECPSMMEVAVTGLDREQDSVHVFYAGEPAVQWVSGELSGTHIIQCGSELAAPTPHAQGAFALPVLDGTCRPAAATGEPCESNSACLSEVCVTGTCVGGKVPPGGVCDQWSDCVNAHYCEEELEEGVPNPNPTCRPAAPDGASCSSANGTGRSCADNLRCIDGTCQSRRSNGGPCTSNSQCVTYACDEPVGGGVGVCIDGLAQGAPCDSDDDDCDTGMSCFEGQCRQRAEAWGRCSDNGDCEGGLYCDRRDATGELMAEPVCRPEGAAGQACDGFESSQCDYPAYCSTGLCITGELDGPCQYASHCGDGLYCDIP